MNTLRKRSAEADRRLCRVHGRSGDYKEDKTVNFVTGRRLPEPPGSPVRMSCIMTWRSDAWLCVRPSGTEPKIKFYYGIKGSSLADADEKSAADGKSSAGYDSQNDVRHEEDRQDERREKAAEKENRYAWEDFRRIIAKLRAPGGLPLGPGADPCVVSRAA